MQQEFAQKIVELNKEKEELEKALLKVCYVVYIFSQSLSWLFDILSQVITFLLMF